MAIHPVALYGGFLAFVLLMLAIDLGVFNRKAHVVTLREAIIWSVLWTVLALLFNAGIWYYAGPTPALEFLTGYIVERALSFDNIFVFVLIFSYFGVPQKYHHRVLFWGVVGALVTRALFIAAGAALITRFGWILYLFGLVLVVSGWKMLTQKNLEVHPDRNLFIRMARKFFPVSTGFETGAFFVRMNGVLHLTPLFLVLLTVETTDVVFAVDSIPAVFGVTQDPFIVFTSNIFAILGLRATYFLLAGMMESFPYLSHGLSLVLIFIGVKMLIADLVHVPVGLSLGIVVLVLAIAIIASLIRRRT
ncbi:TerC family protein [bacterium]|nr:TerC family protein [bacterium]